MGRPKIPDDEKRSKRVPIPVTIEELDEIKRAVALQSGQERLLAVWARGVLLRAARRAIRKGQE